MTPSAAQEISVPRSRATPANGTAWAASCQPAIVSWSVRPTTSRPAPAAFAMSSAGESVPSEQAEWVWGSIRTGTV